MKSENYMRRMPLREGVDVGSMVVSTDLAKATTFTPQNNSLVDVNATAPTRHCSARLMPVDMPAPLGPKLWILGEPVVQKYYTVYDWSALKIGFGLANSHRNVFGPADRGTKGSLPAEVIEENLQLGTETAVLW